MSLDAATLHTLLLVFFRAGAMLFATPFFGAQNVPVQIRTALSLVLGLALTPMVHPLLGPPPTDVLTLVCEIGKEVATGLVIGTMIQIFLLAVQMAGSILDLQIGFGSAQILNPVTGVPVTIVARFKYMLALVLLLVTNGHHFLFEALVRSYQIGAHVDMSSIPAMYVQLPQYLGSLCVFALQIAAPVTAVCVIVDVALGVVNKSVPQMQTYIVGLPAKIVMGLLTMAIGLPVLVVGVQNGVEQAYDGLAKILVGRS